MSLIAVVEDVFVDADVRRYIVDLVGSTHSHRQVMVGASPRGSLALLKLVRAWAVIQGRNYVIPDDVRQFTLPVLGHRIILDPSLWGSKKSENTVIDEVVRSVPVPVLADAGRQ
jgi:MoxR-like ATPase